MSDAQAWLGKLLPDDAARDATHIAVVPMIAATEMEPGSHCGVVASGRAGLVSEDKQIGIVDPFLRENVRRGERFYLCLYPRSVSGLRHVYTHPALDDEVAAPSQKQASEQWLREFAQRYSGDYTDMIAGASTGAGTCFGDDIEYSDFRSGSEFWRHVSVVTGQTFTDVHMEHTSFRCAC